MTEIDFGPDVGEEVDGPLLGHSPFGEPIVCRDWDDSSRSGTASVPLGEIHTFEWEVFHGIVVRKGIITSPPLEWLIIGPTE